VRLLAEPVLDESLVAFVDDSDEPSLPTVGDMTGIADARDPPDLVRNLCLAVCDLTRTYSDDDDDPTFASSFSRNFSKRR
jgi:hypothetical protein